MNDYAQERLEEILAALRRVYHLYGCQEPSSCSLSDSEVRAGLGLEADAPVTSEHRVEYHDPKAAIRRLRPYKGLMGSAEVCSEWQTHFRYEETQLIPAYYRIEVDGGGVEIRGYLQYDPDDGEYWPERAVLRYKANGEWFRLPCTEEENQKILRLARLCMGKVIESTCPCCGRVFNISVAAGGHGISVPVLAARMAGCPRHRESPLNIIKTTA